MMMSTILQVDEEQYSSDCDDDASKPVTVARAGGRGPSLARSISRSGFKTLSKTASSISDFLTVAERSSHDLLRWKEWMEHRAKTGKLGLSYSKSKRRRKPSLGELDDDPTRNLTDDICRSLKSLDEIDSLRDDIIPTGEPPPLSGNPPPEDSFDTLDRTESEIPSPKPEIPSPGVHESSSGRMEPRISFCADISLKEFNKNSPLVRHKPGRFLRRLSSKNSKEHSTTNSNNGDEKTKSILKFKQIPLEEATDTGQTGVRYVFRADAWKQYKSFCSMNDEYNMKKSRIDLDRKIRCLQQKKQRIQTIIDNAKTKYDFENFDEFISRQEECEEGCRPIRDDIYVKAQLEKIPVHRPIFVIVITLINIIVLSTILGLYRGVTDIGLKPILDIQHSIQTFRGLETFSHWKQPNMWIGPSRMYLLRFGALFAPCMRNDYRVRILKDDKNGNEVLGCCEMGSRNTAGTTTESECSLYTNGVGFWRSDYTCNERPSGLNSVRHALKPCCVSTLGECSLLSYEHCVLVGGLYNDNGPEHCRQLDCMDVVCATVDAFTETEPKLVPTLVRRSNQWWRLIVSLFYHNGVIHLLLSLAVLFTVVKRLEVSLGWARVLIIYSTCGITGNLIAGILSPESVTVGSLPCVAGFLAVLYIELLQCWRITDRPLIKVVKLMMITSVLFISGTLPMVNNFAIFGGFFTGILTSFIFIPYITLGRWDLKRKRCLLCSSVPTLLLILIIIIVTFFHIQPPAAQGLLKKFNCVPYFQSSCVGE